MPERDIALLDDIRQAQKDGILSVQEETAESVSTYDYDQGREITYRLVPHDRNSVKALIHILPAAAASKLIDADWIAGLVLAAGQDMLRILSGIYIISAPEDVPELMELTGAAPEEIPEQIPFEPEDADGSCLGVSWHDRCSIIVDVAAISKAVDELEQESGADMLPFDWHSEFRFGFGPTLLHEIRHMGLSDPFPPVSGYPPELGSEEAVEQWALDTYESWLYDRNGIRDGRSSKP